MPGLTRSKVLPVSTSSSSSPVSGLCTPDSRISSSIWSRSNTDDVDFAQLEKFWNELSTEDRRALLRIDKQALFEQIVAYGKSVHAAIRNTPKNRKIYPENPISNSAFNSALISASASASDDDTRDPSLHPWGGLAATKDSMLTVLDCFLEGTPLEVLQNVPTQVFESARGRERERELLYPDACGGSGRGWISVGNSAFGPGRTHHGMKETCALHTARLSCEALVDFWSALSEETRRSLLRMKEEDFIERLMFRFDSKRFCRDCRRNVLREFKEMKELKRARKEPRCTRWFCAADTSFQYEVSDSTVQADWADSFAGEIETLYQRFEWALGTGEGKFDIFGFEDVGLSGSIMVEGLELGTLPDCFITIRAWKRDGRFNVLSVKAHGLKGELCVHRRLFVGDGLVSITEGDSIGLFFEHAEETEEEEDEDGLDKDGNEIDGEGSSRSQKHAKSPELARDFLLDAATVIFKEQVEKAFREGTARQNAHSIFVSLALGLLEDRVRVACKEIATLERQNKLLEEEEHEKREEEERRERRKLKEKEKKLRRKEKQKSKGREKEKVKSEQKENQSELPKPASRVTEVRHVPDGSESVDMDQTETCNVEDAVSSRNGNGAFIVEQSKPAKRRSNGKRQQQVADSRYGRRNTGNGEHKENSDFSTKSKDRSNRQDCGCTTMREVTRKASVLDMDTMDTTVTTVANGTNGTTEMVANVDSVELTTDEPRYVKMVTNEDRDTGKDECESVTKEGTGETEGETLHEVPAARENEKVEISHTDVDVQSEPQSSLGDSASESSKAAVSDKVDVEVDSHSTSSSSCASSPIRGPKSEQAPKPAPRFFPPAASSTTVHRAEPGRNGFINHGNGGGHHYHGHNGGNKGHFPEMPPQVRHPIHMHGGHHHGPPPVPMHRPPPPGPAPGYGCYPVWSHHHYHHQPPPRNNFMPPPHGGPPPFLVAGPPPAAFGYPPRYAAAPPPRMMHPPMRLPPEDPHMHMREMGPPPNRPPWMVRPPPPPAQATPPVSAWRPTPPPPPPPPSTVVEGVCLGGDPPLQSAAFSLQSDKPSDFSLFHFGGPATSVTATAPTAPPPADALQTTTTTTSSSASSGGSSSANGSADALVESGSPSTATSSVSFDSGADFPLQEHIADILDLPSKCMGRLPSGIKSGSEYSLFAAAPGKGFGFF